jgi:O-antigen ligase
LFPFEVLANSVVGTQQQIAGTQQQLVLTSGCFLLAGVVCGTWILRQMLLRRSAPIDSSRLVLAAVMLGCISILSFIIGQFPWFDVPPAPMRAQIGGLGLFLLSVGVFLVVGHEVKALRHLRRLTWLFVGTGGLAVVGMFIPISDIAVGRLGITAHGSVGSLFFTWLVAMSVSQALCNPRISGTTRVLALAVAAVTIGRGLFSTFDWASGWVPPLVALGTVLLLRFPRTTLASGLLLAAPGFFAVGRAWEALMTYERWSWLTRVEAQRVMWQVIEREPWLGFGPANYHYYTPLFSILGYNIRFNSHNNYIDVVAQTGIIGLLLFVWLSVEAVRLALRLRARLPRGFEHAYAVGALGGIAGSLVAGLLADWIVPFVYNIGIAGFRSSMLFWFFLGGLVALRRCTDVAPVRVEARTPGREHRFSPWALPEGVAPGVNV